MQDFIHYVGRKYYPMPRDFADEAVRSGVTRRLPLNAIKSMEFGDVAHLAMRIDGETHIFGYFTIELVSGLSADAIAELREVYGDRVGEMEGEPELIERKCGQYFAMPAIHVELSLAEIMEVLDRFENPGKVMIGGAYHDAPNPGIITGIKHFQGFKRFNYYKYCRAIYASADSKVEWDFDGTGQREIISEGKVQEVKGYKRLEEMGSNQNQQKL